MRLTSHLAGPRDTTITSPDPLTPARYPRATLAATILGSGLAFTDGSVINVALPAVARDLHASPSNVSRRWVCYKPAGRRQHT
jgi:hypothetical protein